MRKFILISLIILLLGLVLATLVSAGDSPGIESCDSAGNTKDTFDPGDPVYLKGSGLKPDWSYDVYIVVDYDPWLEDETDLNDLTVVVTILDVPTDSSGKLGRGRLRQPIPIWDSADPGYYDIWADRATSSSGDGNGIYDASDRIDDLDIGTAGFFVISETPLGTVAVLLAGFTAVLFKRKRIY